MSASPANFPSRQSANPRQATHPRETRLRWLAGLCHILRVAFMEMAQAENRAQFSLIPLQAVDNLPEDLL
jgi:hypothetical protein